ncbi:subtilisin-like protein [Coleophoma cylindrospora]|uniref:tripeptidyl-peptidase II n=1 Tax=Coleophoma cylindrospora TaxID=1849047 RepID=A0A3D8R6Y3_9HELO|nr:subtilisin-like protein [Coleophoma cylindrospora]
MHLSILPLLALATSSCAFPALFGRSSMRKTSELFDTRIAESLAYPPNGWELDENAVLDKDTSMIKLRIHLEQQGMSDFQDLAMKIATPGHELYGSHLPQHAINAMIAPKDESRDLVMNWLDKMGVKSQASMAPRGDAILVEASVADVEKLLGAEYSVFERTGYGETVIRTLEYSLPKVLKGHVSFVQPTTFFGLRTMRSTISEVKPVSLDTESVNAVEAVTGCSGSTITPTCLANLYNLTSSTSTQTAGLMGVAGFLQEYASKSDLTTFMSKYKYFSNGADTYTCTAVNSGSCPTSPSSPGAEANLDVQYARALTKDIPNVYYSTGGSPPWLGTGTNTNEPYLEFLDYFLALDSASLPNTLSISYGDDESTVPLYYATEVCNLFSQLGARGVSVLVAAGDSGVGTSCTSGSTKTFTTSFPAGCPWVTTVGGTTGNTPEKAWTDGGGGFSEIFGRPSYQDSVVSTWLSTDTTHSGVTSYFNSSGRAYPDIAAQATNFVIVISGSAVAVTGTSCSTPTFASLVQLLNSDRIASGKSGLGFLNPWLYSTGSSGLTDITSGSITGCSGVISGAGFSAVSGWDPATGLGTPNYGKLLALSQAT